MPTTNEHMFQVIPNCSYVPSSAQEDDLTFKSGDKSTQLDADTGSDRGHSGAPYNRLTPLPAEAKVGEPALFDRDSKFDQDLDPNVLWAWWPEILSLFIAIVAFSGIFVVVYPYRMPRSAPDWPSAITLNTVISILSVILRAGLVVAATEALGQQKWIWLSKTRRLKDISTFDRASRGPGGSFLLLTTSSSWTLMSTSGAVLIIMTVAVGPFAQQLVHFNDCLLPSSTATASIPRMAAYLDFTQDGSAGINGQIPLPMQKSINAAIFSPQANIIPFNCKSGRCSFTEPYHSLGCCSQCKDTTGQLRSRNGYLYLPSGTFIPVNSSSFPTTDLVSNSPGPSTNSIQAFGPHNIIYGTFEHCTDSNKEACPSYEAVECYLGPCVRSYTAEVTNGILSEKIVNTFTIFTSSPSPIGNDLTLLNIPCMNLKQRQALEDQGLKIPKDKDWMHSPYKLNIAHADWTGSGFNEVEIDPHLEIPVHCHYQMDLSTISGLDSSLNYLLGGNLTEPGEGIGQFTGAATHVVMFNGARSSFAVIDDIFHNIATAITYSIRRVSDDTWPKGWPYSTVSQPIVSRNVKVMNAPTKGIVLENTTCVEVRWGWLAFPAALILLTTLYLVLAMVKTSVHARNRSMTSTSGWRPPGVWKSSILPYMFHGLEDSSLRNTEPDRFIPMKEMERAADTISVRLDQTEDGWKLLEINQELRERVKPSQQMTEMSSHRSQISPHATSSSINTSSKKSPPLSTTSDGPKGIRRKPVPIFTASRIG